MENMDKLEKYPYVEGYWPAWLSWRRTSFQHLELAETKLFSYVKSKCELFFMPIRNNSLYLRTLIAIKCEKLEKKLGYKEKIPIVLIHGMGAGIGLWCKNIDSISEHRKLYALDLLGFGFSSRVAFPDDPTEIENIYAESLEEWRKKLGLNKFILLGHSLGGYLACSYAIKYPENVRHLILADPWGFPKYDPKPLEALKTSFIRRALFFVMQSLNPLALIRFAGPMGPGLIQRFRPELGRFFQGEESLEDSPVDSSVESNDVFDYIYHCNAQYPSGEMGFKTLSYNVGWARHPMIKRAVLLDKAVPVSFIYGEESWMDMNVGLEFQSKRPDSFVNIQIIPKCGHHIYVEDAIDFNNKVNEICSNVDMDRDTSVTTDISQFLNKDKNEVLARRMARMKSK